MENCLYPRKQYRISRHHWRDTGNREVVQRLRCQKIRSRPAPISHVPSEMLADLYLSTPISRYVPHGIVPQALERPGQMFLVAMSKNAGNDARNGDRLEQHIYMYSNEETALEPFNAQEHSMLRKMKFSLDRSINGQDSHRSFLHAGVNMPDECPGWVPKY